MDVDLTGYVPRMPRRRVDVTGSAGEHQQVGTITPYFTEPANDNVERLEHHLLEFSRDLTGADFVAAAFTSRVPHGAEVEEETPAERAASDRLRLLVRSRFERKLTPEER